MPRADALTPIASARAVASSVLARDTSSSLMSPSLKRRSTSFSASSRNYTVRREESISASSSRSWK